jgi:hypothetical protein
MFEPCIAGASDVELTTIRTACRILHMKTTLIIPDHLTRELERRAARRGKPFSAS